MINSPKLIVPHSGIADRAFVLYPLAEIAPDLVIPGKGPIADLLLQCPRDGLTRISGAV
jgi:2-amino-4-hydroxy-6-hydroxymethyldihydropteridine diphosphokinase